MQTQALTWMGKIAASRTRKGLTLKALLRAAAWYTAPMAAASSALMFFPSSSLHTQTQRYMCTEEARVRREKKNIDWQTGEPQWPLIHYSS